MKKMPHRKRRARASEMRTPSSSTISNRDPNGAHDSSHDTQGRDLELRDELFKRSELYSPGCASIAKGRAYTVGTPLEFGFKYKLQVDDLSDASILSLSLSSSSSSSHPAEISTDESTDPSPSSDNYDDLESMLTTNPHSDLDPLGTLEQRMQKYLQEKLVYCPGSGDDVQKSEIDGVAVDLSTSQEKGACNYQVDTYCTMTGIVTLYTQSDHAHSSSLESMQVGLAALRAGIVEHAFEDKLYESNEYYEKDAITKVEFLGGVVGVTEVEGGARLGFGSPNDIGGGLSASSIISFDQYDALNATGRQTWSSFTQLGQRIIIAYTIVFVFLLFAKWRQSARETRESGELERCPEEDEFLENGDKLPRQDLAGVRPHEY